MSAIKALIKHFLNHFGYEITRYDSIKDAPFNLLEFILKHLMTKHPDFFFLQIGANDGEMGDPLFNMVKQHHLKGLLIEPLPDAFASLRKNYDGQQQLTFENCAISEETGKGILYKFKKEPEVPSWAFGMASFEKAHLLKFKDLLQFKHLIEEIEVPTLSFNDLCEKHGITKIDLLQIDTEGYDFNIIRMVFDSTIRPLAINFEHEHLSPESKAACKKLLIDNGYKFIAYGRDTLAIHHSVRPSG